MIATALMGLYCEIVGFDVCEQDPGISAGPVTIAGDGHLGLLQPFKPQLRQDYRGGLPPWLLTDLNGEW